MKKRILIKAGNFAEAVAKAAEVLKQGGVIAYPTETLYGLGASLSKEQAVARIRKIKGKPEPILALVSGAEMAERYVELDDRARKLIEAFWPGPLTLILKARPGISDLVRAGSAGLGLRMSSDRFAKALVKRAGEAITSTSANLSGKKPWENADEIEAELGLELDLIVDDGKRAGKASTVLDLLGGKPKLIREGQIQLNEIKMVMEWQE